MPKIKYIIIHNHREYNEDNLEAAINKCKMLVAGNEENDTALIISRVEYNDEFPDKVRIRHIYGFRWVDYLVYEFVTLDI